MSKQSIMLNSTLRTTRSLPQLPTELWLQIVENISDPSYIWTTLRRSSPDFESYVDKVFLSTYLPKVSASASLPRRDPSTNALRHQHDAPEITFQFSDITSNTSYLTLATSTVAKTGASIKHLKTTGVLSQQRLEEAVMWVSIGCSRAQATPMDIVKNIEWNEIEGIWVWNVEWTEFVDRYFDIKTAKREELERRKKPTVRRK
jgi:hypothetical protein